MKKPGSIIYGWITKFIMFVFLPITSRLQTLIDVSAKPTTYITGTGKVIPLVEAFTFGVSYLDATKTRNPELCATLETHHRREDTISILFKTLQNPESKIEVLFRLGEGFLTDPATRGKFIEKLNYVFALVFLDKTYVTNIITSEDARQLLMRSYISVTESLQRELEKNGLQKMEEKKPETEEKPEGAKIFELSAK